MVRKSDLKKGEKFHQKFMWVMLVKVFVIKTIFLKYVWSWIIPELFPQAVSQGLILGTLTWTLAAKLAFIIVLLLFFKKMMMYKKHEYFNKGK